MKFKKILGIFFVLALITTTVFGFSAENSRQDFGRNFTNLHQGFGLGKVATTPGLAAFFSDFSRQVFLLGQSGKGVQTTSKTLWKGKQGKIDVENPNPGQRPGQVHFQA